MASLIPGYEYDVFISYRQKDNKHDGWVTEFVDNLKGELESTFKEEISVYFDLNPHDGLLETQDVDESLKDKLKCLIFIPIISRTYCDPKSYAWEHEFKIFVEQASKDRLGLKVKLLNGNVASRVLPVQIHELEADDKKMVESELGWHLRGIEFIYKEPGVDRPLTEEDNEEKNLYKTNYRNQINKVALAIREVITTLKQHGSLQEEELHGKFKPMLSTGKNHRTAIIAGLALVFIVLGFLFIPKLLKPSGEIEKSIAVLPFNLLSNEPGKQYLADGMMDAITLHLSKIKDLRVLGRTSTEQYRNPAKTLTAIGKELGVSYLLEGSFQKFGDSVRLIVQVIKTGKEGHVWANNYDRLWKNVFSVQSEVAKSIARELNAVITPEEKQRIEKVPTSDMSAYNLYLKANEYRMDYSKTRNLNSYQTALNLYKTALKIDSTFAKAYTGLAAAYYYRYKWESYFKKTPLDSMMVFAKKALSFDDQSDEAYFVKGVYYYTVGPFENALENFDKALKINPNYYLAYYAKGILLISEVDFIEGINIYNKALTLISRDEQPLLLRDLGAAYGSVGFIDKAKYYYGKAFTMDGDTASYFNGLKSVEFDNGNFENGILYREKAFRIDSSYDQNDLYWLIIAGQHQEAYILAEKLVRLFKESGDIPLANSHRIAYSFRKMGKFKEADYYFKLQLEYCNESIKSNLGYAQSYYAYYDRAGVNAFMGEKEKAYEDLKIFKKRKEIRLWMVILMKNDPLFDSIRNETEFQKIVRDIEAKYQAEHERIRKWLEEQGML
jgi:TolB-like protein/Tfp pilus assembly protein PilF